MTTNSATAEAKRPANSLKFFGPRMENWKDLVPSESNEKNKEITPHEHIRAKEELNTILLSSLQMQHILSLAGSGTSLGDVGGPSMKDLWNACVQSPPNKEGGKQEPTQTKEAKKVINKIGYDTTKEGGNNIEDLLSRCDAYLQIKNDKYVKSFLTKSKEKILNLCSDFLNPPKDNILDTHRKFLHRLSRRRARDSRMKLFTTNYDLCFELAAGKQGLVAIDGFSFTQPRLFDPRFFLYDIVRRPTNGESVGTPIEGIFHLYKLHGSVNWSRSDSGDIEINSEPTPERACLIYPAKGKYQQSYIQPHLELISQYLTALREPNTCVIVVGFGFNDDHLSEPIVSAVQTNPHLRLIIVNPTAKELTKEKNSYWGRFLDFAKQGEDVWLINATFGEFVEMIPDLKSLTPAQQLVRDIKSLVKSA